MRWPWSRQRDVNPEAVDALQRARADLEVQRRTWHAVLDSAEDMRALRVRNHFADRLANAYGAHPLSTHGPVPHNRRKDDPR